MSTSRTSRTSRWKFASGEPVAATAPDPSLPPAEAVVKPPYRVPSMDEVRAIPWNGRTVVSTFSGCGGSCLGFRMAGFRVAWANEFVEAARDSYRMNADPGTVLDPRNIRDVRAEDILEAIGMRPGELDVFEGSPPCVDFSTAGKREKGWGHKRQHADGSIDRADDLFLVWAGLLRGLQPKCFVAENVTGLIKGTSKGYFQLILAELRACGYVVESRVLDARHLGVPQARQRVFFMGVRQDLADRGARPAWPVPLPYEYSVRDALPWLSAGAQEARRQDIGGARRLVVASDSPAPAMMVGGIGSVNTSQYRLAGNPFEGDMRGTAVGREWEKLREGQQSERFFSLIRADPESPAGTISSVAHGAGIMHPYECRRFTIAELRRIGAFPDDFALTGAYKQQWARIGNSVPPVMMRAVAEVIRDVVLKDVS